MSARTAVLVQSNFSAHSFPPALTHSPDRSLSSVLTMTMTHARYGALVHQRIVLFFWYSQIERLTQQVLVLSSTVAAPFSRCPSCLSKHTVLSVLADNAART